MPKNFKKMNFYERLDIGPTAAAFEIRHAYNAACQMYTSGSLVSYSFFSQKEREEILLLIEEAYQTLINEQTRKQYHAELVGRGELAEEDIAVTQKKPIDVFAFSSGHRGGVIVARHDALKEKIAESETINAILQKKNIGGADLKQIRQELGIELEHIAKLTKIRVDYLRHIEADAAASLPAPVFLKGFLKSYLKCLCLEPVEEISGRYLARLARSGGG